MFCFSEPCCLVDLSFLDSQRAFSNVPLLSFGIPEDVLALFVIVDLLLFWRKDYPWTVYVGGKIIVRDALVGCYPTMVKIV
jgi:hypothetical protein